MYAKEVMPVKDPFPSAKETTLSRRVLYESSSSTITNVNDRPVKLARTGGRRVTGFHGCLDPTVFEIRSAS